jgi:hypothetical protein
MELIRSLVEAIVLVPQDGSPGVARDRAGRALSRELSHPRSGGGDHFEVVALTGFGRAGVKGGVCSESGYEP